MKKKLLILFISVEAHSQQLKYQNELVKNITITSRKQKIFSDNAVVIRNITHIKTKNTIDKYVIKYPPEPIQFSTSLNIFSCKFISLIFKREGQEVFEVRQDVVGRADTTNTLKMRSHS